MGDPWSNDPTSVLLERLTGDDPLRSETAQIEDWDLLADQLGEVPANGMTLLEPVAAEPGGLVKPADTGPLSENRVGIESVLCVEAGPGANHFESVECGQDGGQNGPDDVVELRPWRRGEVKPDGAEFNAEIEKMWPTPGGPYSPDSARTGGEGTTAERTDT